jgi:hypothetical protein
MEKSKLTETERGERVKVNSMLIIYFDIKGIVRKEFVLTKQTATSAYFCVVLRRMRENL